MVTKRKLSKWLGLLWVAGVAIAGSMLIIYGRLGVNRASMIFLFFAAAPGAMAYRWGAADWESDLRPIKKKANSPNR
jgi:hypothetical protein